MTQRAGRNWSAILVTLLAAVLLCACGKSDSGSIKARGYVRIAVANEIPYGYLDNDGKAHGIAPDIARRTLNNMGYHDLHWVVLPFGSLIPALNAGRVDLVAAGQAILPARCKVVRFSRPNSSYGEGMLVAAGNPRHINGYQAFLRNQRLRLGIVSGADELDIAQALHVPDAQLVTLASNTDAVGALRGKRIDAYAATRLSALRLAHKTQGVELAQPFADPIVNGHPVRSYGAFAFRRNALKFSAAFDKALAAVQATRFYTQTLHHYGLTDKDIAAARAASTAALCAGN